MYSEKIWSGYAPNPDWTGSFYNEWNIGKKIQGEIEMLQGASPELPVMVSNTKYWMGPDVIAARGLRSRVRDYGRVWDFDGKSAEICPIHWHGPR